MSDNCQSNWRPYVLRPCDRLEAGRTNHSPWLTASTTRATTHRTSSHLSIFTEVFTEEQMIEAGRVGLRLAGLPSTTAEIIDNWQNELDELSNHLPKGCTPGVVAACCCRRMCTCSLSQNTESLYYGKAENERKTILPTWNKGHRICWRTSNETITGLPPHTASIEPKQGHRKTALIDRATHHHLSPPHNLCANEKGRKTHFKHFD